MAPRVAVSQITTLGSSFADDLRTYVAAGLDGIGIWELKLPEGGDSEALEQLEASGLDRAAAVPAIPSILPLPLLGGPEDPAERIDAYCRSLERLAPFDPSSTVLLTGTGDREVAVAGARQEHGVRRLERGQALQRPAVRIDPLGRILRPAEQGQRQDRRDGRDGGCARETARLEPLERVVFQLQLPDPDPVEARRRVRADVVGEARPERRDLRDRDARRHVTHPLMTFDI